MDVAHVSDLDNIAQIYDNGRNLERTTMWDTFLMENLSSP